MTAVDKPASAAENSPRIRNLQTADLVAMAELHTMAFPGFFLTLMGRTMLRRYYDLVRRFEGGILLGFDHNGRLIGFIAGFIDPAAFYQFMARQKRRFLLPILMRVLCRPWLVKQIWCNVRRVESGGTPDFGSNARPCELSSLAVDPNHSGQGFGKKLVSAFLDAAKARCANCVYLTTDAEDNDRINNFYQQLGFHRTRTFRQYGQRSKHEYLISLE